MYQTRMKKIIILLAMAALGACAKQPQEVLLQGLPAEVALGLGYGFLDKQVDVYINGDLILSMVGTQEIEDHAQLLGTKIVKVVKVEGNTADVQVILDGVKSKSFSLNLADGRIIEIYNHPLNGLFVSNTPVLILE